MIQRIQSIYLAIALILTGGLFYSKLATLVSATESYSLKYNGIIAEVVNNSNVVLPALALQMLLIITTLAIITTIFLYKKRLLQIRIGGLSIGLLVGLSGLIYYFGKMGAKELVAEVSFNWTIIAPIISIILIIMAMISIAKDEALVKSLDRLR